MYRETGLNRKEYSPCASAMVAELDQMQSQLQVLGDRSRSKEDRRGARRECFAANSRLLKLIKQAGGKQKLLTPWEDIALSNLNQNIISAQTEYMVGCYYGSSAITTTAESSAHAEARNALSGLR